MNGNYTNYFDKVESKFANFEEKDFTEGGYRVVPNAMVRQGSFIGKNGAAIQRGVSITKDLVTTGTTVGQLAGLLSHDKKSKIDQIADQLYQHAQALGPKKKVKFKAGTKGGNGWARRRLTV